MQLLGTTVGMINMSNRLLAHSRRLDISQRLFAITRINITDLLEGNRGHERSRFPSLVLLGIHLIDLFKRKTLGLINKTPNEERTDQTEASPKEEHLGTHVDTRVRGSRVGVHHIGSSIGDGPVEKPIGSGGHGKTFGAGFEREDLTGDDPGDGTPGGGEEENVEADERDEDFAGGLAVRVCGAGDGDDELADEHADGTPEEHGAATPFLDHVETGNGTGEG